MIDPEFWSDEEVGSWSYKARLLYIGIWNFADDSGRFRAHNGLLKSQIFPYDTRIDTNSLKREIEKKVKWYQKNGQLYGYVINFAKYQRIDRPSESKLPDPFAEHSSNVRGALPPNISEVKLREVKTTQAVTEKREKFERLWLRHPKREGKGLGWSLFSKTVVTTNDWKNIKTALENLRRYIKSEKIELRYIKPAGDWLKIWQDWIKPPTEENQLNRRGNGQ